jgi:hypothetical protein
MTSHSPTMISDLAGSNWMAWIESGGAIAAIAVVLWVVWLQPRAVRKARQKGILALAEAALARARQIGAAFAQPNTLDISSITFAIHQQTAIDGIVQALTNVAAREIGARDAVAALSSLRDQLRSLGPSIEIFERRIKDPETLKRLLALDGAQRRQYLTARQPALADNVRDRLATIQKDYDTLARALHQGAAPLKTRPWRGWIWIATSFFLVMFIVVAVAGRTTSRR